MARCLHFERLSAAEFAEQYESEDEGFSGGLKAAATREFKNCCKAEERVARSAARWNATAVRELEAFLEGKLKVRPSLFLLQLQHDIDIPLHL